MTVKEFVDGYNSQLTKQLKDKFFNEKIKLEREYIPYVEKMAYVKNVVDATSFDYETGIYKINTPMRFILYTMMMIDKYTSLEIIYEDESYSLMTQYDLLNKNDLLALVLSLIPDKEETEFKLLLNMEVDDCKFNNTTIESVLNKIYTNIINEFSKIDISKIQESIDKINK